MRRLVLALCAALLPATAPAAVLSTWDFVPDTVGCSGIRIGQSTCADEIASIRDALSKISLTLTGDPASLIGSAIGGSAIGGSGIAGATFPDGSRFDGSEFLPLGSAVNIAVSASANGLIGRWFWNNGSQDATMRASVADAWAGVWNSDGPFMTCGRDCSPVFNGHWQARAVDAPSTLALLLSIGFGVALWRPLLRRRLTR